MIQAIARDCAAALGVPVAVRARVLLQHGTLDLSAWAEPSAPARPPAASQG